MSATGLDVFDKTLQTTNIWLNEIMEKLGPDRQIAWRALGAVLRALRDRLPLDLAAHLGAELPILVRGTYYDQWHSPGRPDKTRSLEPFLDRIAKDPRCATHCRRSCADSGPKQRMLRPDRRRPSLSAGREGRRRQPCTPDAARIVDTPGWARNCRSR